MKTFFKTPVLVWAVAPLIVASVAFGQEASAPEGTADQARSSPLPQPRVTALDRTQSGVRIKLPGEHAIRLLIGDSIDIDQLGENNPGKKARSVFNPEFLKNRTLPIPLGPRTNYEVATMNSVEEITRKSSLAVSASVSGAWGSASASYNRKRFSYVGKEILQANLDLKTSVEDEALDLRYEKPAEVFTGDIVAKIAAAEAAKSEPTKLMMLRREFRDQYGTCFVIEIEKGARYRVVFSKQIDHTKRIDEQSTSFSASVNAYCNKVKTSVQTAKQDINELQRVEITTTGELEGGPTTVLVHHDLESFLQYINDTGNKGKPGDSWIKAAIQTPSKLHAVVVPFSAVPELALLSSGPTGIGGAGEVRQIAPFFPPAHATAPKEISPIAEHEQFSPSWGVISFATVPYPIPVAMRVNAATKTVDVGVQCSAELHAVEASLPSWLNTLDHDVDRTYATVFGGDRRSPPPIAKNSSIELHFSLPTAHGTGEPILTAVGKSEGGPLGVDYPPTAEQLYNQLSDRNGFVYWYRFAPTTAAELSRFLTAAASNDGVQLRTVVNLDELNPVSLRDRRFRVQKQGNDYDILSPILLEANHSEESLRRLYAIEAAFAQLKANLEIPIKATIDGRRNPIQAPITVGTVPPFATVVIEIAGKIDPWTVKEPRYDADAEGGMLIYRLVSGKPLPKDGKAGKHFRWVNRTGEVQQLRVGHKDTDASNNSGKYELSGAIKLYAESAEPVAEKGGL